MRRILMFLRSTVSIVIVVVAIVGICIWYLAPVIGFGDFRPFEDETTRAVVIGGLVLFAILLIVFVLWRRRRRDRRLAQDIASAGVTESAADAALRSELGEVQARMREALTLLRRAKLGGRGGGQYLYQLPWYIMIGPPGAGKTTAIVNSGLKFPLAERMGVRAVGGVGGTRNCDWWFTNEAVLIDTAGRYTTQDSDAAADARAWSGFLDILKKYRTRQPINGAMVAISLSDLSLLDEPSRRAHALAIRKRLAELRERLGVRFPVYVLFTKADLIAGFQEFFETLGKEGREQVWGFTLPFEAKAGGEAPLARFDPEFDALLGQLNNQSLERMQQETDPQRRSLIHGFPQQLASLREVARDFLTDIFEESRFEERQILRGVYFTSGTQEGTPIDRLMMGMARAFGIGRQAIGSGQGQGRSYFLTRLLQGVIFPEAGIVSHDDRVERRYRWIVRGGLATAAAVLLALGTVWTISYLGNRELVARAEAQVLQYQTLLATVPVNPVADTNLVQVVPALNVLRDMPGNPAQGDPSPPTELTWGLYQGDAIGNEAGQTYRAALNRLLLPRILLRLEEQIAASLQEPDLLYEVLKVYLMLGGQGPMDTDFVTGWLVKVDWEQILFPGETNAQMRADLAGHLGHLLANPMEDYSGRLNGPLVEQAQDILAQTPVATRVYRGIVTSQAARALPVWRVSDAGGPNASRVLVRPSGELLSTGGVDGIYTYRGFHSVFLPSVAGVAKQVAGEAWVLGSRAAVTLTEQNITNIARDVMSLYYADYIANWNRILGDIDIIPAQNLADATAIINVVSGPTSPIAFVLKSISDETRVTEARGPVDTEAAATRAREVGIEELTTGLSARTQVLANILRQTVPGLSPDSAPERRIGWEIEDHFRWLHDFTREEQGRPSPLSVFLGQMDEVYKELNRLSASSNPLVAAPTDGGATDRLVEAATRLPPGAPQRWAKQVANTGAEAVTGGERSRLDKLWKTQVLPFCEKALTGRYPFTKGSSTDVGLADFARLFQPGGLIDAFFMTNLLPHVDTGSNPWRWRRIEGKDLGISDNVLQAFQQAAEIRDTFFLPGTMQITFEVRPQTLDPTAQKVVLELDGQILEFANNAPEWVPMSWPKGGRNRVSLLPEMAGVENTISTDGPWAMFKLLARAVRPRPGAELVAVFNVGGRLAQFQIRAGSAFNPFTLPALNSFRCPRSL